MVANVNSNSVHDSLLMETAKFYSNNLPEGMTHFYEAVKNEPFVLVKGFFNAGLFGWGISGLITYAGIQGVRKAKNKEDRIFHLFATTVGLVLLAAQVKSTIEDVNLPLLRERDAARLSYHETHYGMCFDFPPCT